MIRRISWCGIGIAFLVQTNAAGIGAAAITRYYEPARSSIPDCTSAPPRSTIAGGGPVNEAREA
jgi:hypothetical protein